MGIYPTKSRTKAVLKKLAILINAIIMSTEMINLRWEMVLAKIDKVDKIDKLICRSPREASNGTCNTITRHYTTETVSTSPLWA